MNRLQELLNLELHVAVDCGNIKKVKEVITAGAEVNSYFGGVTPLYTTVVRNNVRMARVLIDCNADLDSLNLHRSTSLHSAALSNHVELACMLIMAGAKTNVPDKLGNSPRFYARTPEMTEVFIEADRMYIAIFSHAMQEGWVDMNILRIAIMGPPATGKTSFVHLLFNWAAPKHHHSTPIGNRPIRAIQRVAAQDEGNVWSIVGIPELKHIMAEAARLLGSSDRRKFAPNPSHQPTSISQFATVLGDNPAFIEGEGEINNHQAILPAMDNEDVVHSKLIPDPSHFPEEVLQSLAEGKTSGALHESTCINVLDSGGQPQFADISRVFIHGNVINIIVLKLTQRLDDKPTFAYSINGKELTQPAELQMTYIQLIQSFVRSIVSAKYTVSKRSIEIKPLFFLIGTYHDYTHGFTSYFRSIEPLEEKNRQLVHALREYKEHLVFCNENNEELIFPVNNMCKSSREKISSHIRHRITCSIQPIPIKIPIRWYMFEVKVKEESLKVAHGMVTLNTCEQIGIKLGMGKQEVSQCIEYLNSHSLFLYFPVLPNLVFTNPQYLLDMVTSLVRVSFVDYPQELHAKCVVLPPNMQRKLRREGLFSKELLHYLSLEFIPALFTNDDLIQLLQYLFIIAPIKKSTTPISYFLPSALPPLHLSKEEKKELTQTCEPLVLLFKNKMIPQGLFLALAVALMGKENVPKMSLDSSIQQLRYAIHLDCDDMDGSVVLVDSYDWLELYYTGLPGSHCRKLLQSIKDVLPTCADTLHYDSSVADVVPTLLCQNKHEKSVPVHPAKLSYVNGIIVATCTEQKKLPPVKLTDERHLAWFSPYTDDHKVIDESLPKKPPKSSGVTTKCLPFILKKSPEKSDVYDLLKKKSAYWEEFALELKLGDSFRQELRREGAVTTSRIKLDKVLMKWIDSETSDVTWSNIINMLEELEFLDLARNVDDYLSKEDVVKKYIQKEDYEEY